MEGREFALANMSLTVVWRQYERVNEFH